MDKVESKQRQKTMHDDIWVSDNEYPDQNDIEAFGYNSPPDDDPLTIGYVGDSRPGFWSAKRIFMLVVIVLMIGILVLPPLLRMSG